jgi:hypothetical protein
MYTEQFTVEAFNFQNLMVLQIEIVRYLQQKNFTFGKMSENLPFLSM